MGEPYTVITQPPAPCPGGAGAILLYTADKRVLIHSGEVVASSSATGTALGLAICRLQIVRATVVLLDLLCDLATSDWEWGGGAPAWTVWYYPGPLCRRHFPNLDILAEPGDIVQLAFLGSAATDRLQALFTVEDIGTSLSSADRIPPFPPDLAHVSMALGLPEVDPWKGCVP